MSIERANDRLIKVHAPFLAIAVQPLYDRSTMLGRLLQTVWVCVFGEETKTKYYLGIRKNVSDNGWSGTFGGPREECDTRVGTVFFGITVQVNSKRLGEINKFVI